MTKLLEQAFSRAQELPDSQQDVIARLSLDEIASERHWEESSARTPQKLRKLAEIAWAEHEAGQSEPLDPDTL